jgi:DNA polymerase-3 subunit epsilon
MGRIVKGPWAYSSSEGQGLVVPSDELEYVAFDVETTGFNKNDRIVEIGFVAFKNGQLLEEWSTLLNPQRDVGKSNIHGITASMVSTAPLFEEIVNDIFRIINGRGSGCTSV